MKTKLLVVGALALALFTSCGGSSDGSSSSGSTVYSVTADDDYRTACKEGNFDKAHDILDAIHDEFQQTWEGNFGEISHKNDNRSRIEAAASKYGTAAQYIYTTEARHLMAESPEEAEMVVLNFFTELQPIGEKVPEGTELHPKGVSEYQQTVARFNCYKEYVKANNALANVIFNLALANSNPILAKLAISHMLETPEAVDPEEEKPLVDKVVGYNTADKDKANETYNSTFNQTL